MNLVFQILVFLSVFFLYIHWMDEYKKGEDLEMLEMDYSHSGSRKKAQQQQQMSDACRLKQPLIFEFRGVEADLFRRMTKGEISKFTSEPIAVYYSRDVSSSSSSSFHLPFDSAMQLMESDSLGRYVSEDNHVFMDDSGLSKTVMARYLQHQFQPGFGNVATRYDLLAGSKNATIPCQYHTDSRYFIGVTAGKIHLQLAPWKNTKYLAPVTKTRRSSKFKSLHENPNIRFLDCVVDDGFVVSIPPYWWYSIKFLTNQTTCFGARYSTFINKLAHVSFDDHTIGGGGGSGGSGGVFAFWESCWSPILTNLAGGGGGGGRGGTRGRGRAKTEMIKGIHIRAGHAPAPAPAPAPIHSNGEEETHNPKEEKEIALALLSPLLKSQQTPINNVDVDVNGGGGGGDNTYVNSPTQDHRDQAQGSDHDKDQHQGQDDDHISEVYSSI